MAINKIKTLRSQFHNWGIATRHTVSNFLVHSRASPSWKAGTHIEETIWHPVHLLWNIATCTPHNAQDWLAGDVWCLRMYFMFSHFVRDDDTQRLCLGWRTLLEPIFRRNVGLCEFAMPLHGCMNLRCLARRRWRSMICLTWARKWKRRMRSLQWQFFSKQGIRVMKNPVVVEDPKRFHKFWRWDWHFRGRVWAQRITKVLGFAEKNGTSCIE